MKLFTKQQPIISKKITNYTIEELEEIDRIASESSEIYKESLEAYDEALDLYGSLKLNTNYINENNIDLYNKYINSLSKRFGLETYVDKDDLNQLGSTGVNIITLEGLGDFISKIWNKIKEIILKMVNLVKNFFTSYFTKKGSVIRKLNNIIEALSEKDFILNMESIDPTNIPEKVKNVFKTEDSLVTPSVIMNYIKDSKAEFLGNFIVHANMYAADKTVSSELLKYINKLKLVQFKKQMLQDKNQEIKDNAGTLGKASIMLGTNKEYNKNIKDIKDANKEINETKNVINKEIEKTKANEFNGIEGEEELKALADKKLDEFLTKYNAIIENNIVNVNIVLAGGKILKIKQDDKNEDKKKILEIEKDDHPKLNRPTSAIYADSKSVISLAKESLNSITILEKNVESIQKFIDSISSVITEYDKIENETKKIFDSVPEEYKSAVNAYKNKITYVLKPLLNNNRVITMQVSKLSTNILDNALEVGLGVIAYSTQSMKYYKEASNK